MERYRKRQSKRRTRTIIIVLVLLVAAIGLIVVGASALFPGCADNLPQINAAQTGFVEHIHVHLDVFVNGNPVVVPDSLGHVSPVALCALHTHDTTGIIHIETPVARSFTVQEIMDVWGYSVPSTATVYVNGVASSLSHNLVAHDEIAIVIGTPPAPIPSSYTFPGNL